MKHFFHTLLQLLKLAPGSGESSNSSVTNSTPLRHQYRMTTEDFLRQAKGIALTPGERAQIKLKLLETMHGPAEHRWLFSLKGFASVTASFIIIVTGGGSISYAAENALPGELLYPIKVQINERVRGSLAKSHEDAARWEAAKAERRLVEAEQLSALSKLSPVLHKTLNEQFKNHMQAMHEQLLAMKDHAEQAGVHDVNTDIEATLRAHSSMLETMKISGTGAEENDELLDSVRAATLESEEEQIEMELVMAGAESVFPTASKLAEALANGESAISALQSRLAANRSLLSPAVLALVESKLSLASKAHSNALATPASLPKEAMRLANVALRNVKEAELCMTYHPPIEELAEDSVQNLSGALKREQNHDMELSASARLGIAAGRIKTIEAALRATTNSGSDLPLDALTTDVEGARQLMDIAKTQMKGGDMKNALDSADLALEHAEGAKNTTEKYLNTYKEKTKEKKEREKETDKEEKNE